MVCVPCFIIPVLLFLWHRFVQPYVLRFWNPWAVKDEAGNVTKPEETQFPFSCMGGVCTFSGKVKTIELKEGQATSTEAAVGGGVVDKPKAE